MVPDKLLNYCLAGAGASATLIGLLFVAVSVAPEHVFGEGASAEQRALAGSAFIALVDAFLVSFVGLIPDTNIGYPALGVGVGALINTLNLARQLWEERRAGPGGQRLTLVVGGLGLYGGELWFAVQVIRQPHDTGYVYGLAYLLVGTYVLGVGRAWELLGARDEGLLSLLGVRRGRRDDAPVVPPGGGVPAEEPTAPSPRSDATSRASD